MVYLFQNIPIAIPIFLAPIGDISPECLDLINHFAYQLFEVDTTKFDFLIELCQKNNIKSPQSIKIFPYSFRSIVDLVNFLPILQDYHYHFFIQVAPIIVFIDNTINSNIMKIQELFSQVPELELSHYFVIFKANKTSAELHLENTCILLESLSQNSAYSCMLKFLSQISGRCAAKLLNFTEVQMDFFSLSCKLRDFKILSDFYGICGNYSDASSNIKNALITQDASQNNIFLGSLFDELSILSLNNPSLRLTKIQEQIQIKPVTWFDSDTFSASIPEKSQNSSFLLSLAYSAALFISAGAYSQAVDIGIRGIFNGSKQAIYPILKLIKQNSGAPGIKKRVFDLLTLCRIKQIPRQALMIAATLGPTFESFYELGLNAINCLFEKQFSIQHYGLEVQNLYIPIINRLYNANVPEQEIAPIITQIMCTVGPSLNPMEQKAMINTLSKFGAKQGFKFPISLTNSEFLTPQCQIKDLNHRSAYSQVFLYSYLQRNILSNKETLIANNQTLSICANFLNPFSEPIPVLLYPNLEGSQTNFSYQKVVLQPNQKNVVHLHFTPKENGKLLIKGITMVIFKVKQIFTFQTPYKVLVIDSAPTFNFRTDLPLTSVLSLFQSEKKHFTIWIINTSNCVIDEVSLTFSDPSYINILNDIPSLQPGEEIAIPCEIIDRTSFKNKPFSSQTPDDSDNNQKIQKDLEMSISSKVNGGKYICSISLVQKLVIQQGLDVARVFLINKTNNDNVTIGFEVSNHSDCTFFYNSTINGSSNSGLIGGFESALLTANISPHSLKDAQEVPRQKIIYQIKKTESILERGLTQEERLRIQNISSVLYNLESYWDFEWAISNLRKGCLNVSDVNLDPKLLSEIEERKVNSSFKWISETEQIKIGEIVNLLLEFDEPIKNCSLILPETDIDEGNVLWEGELEHNSETGEKAYQFSLCFCVKNQINIIVKFETLKGISCQRIITTSVIE